MGPTKTFKKPKTPYEQKKERRRAILFNIVDLAAIYFAVAAGVMLTESILDIQQSGELRFSFAFDRIIIAGVVAAFFMAQFETGGNPDGKKRNFTRRITHAFSQGAALRGIIEWLFLLFSMTRG